MQAPNGLHFFLRKKADKPLSKKMLSAYRVLDFLKVFIFDMSCKLLILFIKPEF